MIRISTNRGGDILNISSVQGLMAWPAMLTYSAAKAGMIRPTPIVEFQVFLIKISTKILKNIYRSFKEGVVIVIFIILVLV